MRKALVGLPFAGLLVVLVLAGYSSYDGLVAAQVRMRGVWANVDTLLQRRSDLLPPVVRTVGDLVAHRPNVLVPVTRSRAQLEEAATPAERIAAAQEMDAALSELLVAVESDSQLCEDDLVEGFEKELTITERRLSIERRAYNEAATQFNTMIQRFPANLFANMLGFKPEPLYREAPAAAAADSSM